MNVIVSGGQSGVDRAALDVALELGIPYGGWCPATGWAEDFPKGGLCQKYPGLKPTPSADPAQRTEWNVRDSDATLILLPQGYCIGGGTELTKSFAAKYKRRMLQARLGDPGCLSEVWSWLRSFETPIALNVAGPRESESPGAYAAANRFLSEIFACLKNSAG